MSDTAPRPAWMPEMPKAVVNLKNVPEADRTLWVRESVGEIEDALGNASDLDFIVVHRQHGLDNFERMLVNAADFVTVTVYS